MIGFLKRARRRAGRVRLGRRPGPRIIAASEWFRIEHHPDDRTNPVHLYFLWLGIGPIRMTEGDADELSEALYLAAPPLLPEPPA